MQFKYINKEKIKNLRVNYLVLKYKTWVQYIKLLIIR